MQPQVFEIPSSSGTSWLPAVFLIPLLISAVAAFVFWPRPLSVELSADALEIKGSIYGRKIPKSSLDLAQARITNFGDEPALRPVMRTNGMGMPSYRVGWFRLKDRSRALCFLTGGESVLFLPTTENYALLITMPDAPKLLAALRGSSS